jgi:hypothetical protein
MSIGLQCVGVIGPNNAPLHFTTFSDGDTGDTDANAFLHILHCALDEVEIRLAGSVGGVGVVGTGVVGAAPHASSSTPPNPSAAKDSFLGMVFPTELHKVYAYATNTHVKFLLVYDDAEGDPQEHTVREIFKKIHEAYADAMCDPFEDAFGARIENRAFREKIEKLKSRGR